MKGLKWSLAVMTAALLIAGLGGMAFAFHSGGVADCGGCHSMHDAQGGALLTKHDIGSTCLNCHEKAGATGPDDYHISTAETDLTAGAPPLQRSPGGDFAWLKKSYAFSVRGETITEDGATHGHNVKAEDNLYFAVTGTSPGGSFNSPELSCTSCHDMHGTYRRFADGSIDKTGLPISNSGSYHNSAQPVAGSTAVGVFRLLAGQGWTAGSVVFDVDPPAAVVNRTYNAKEDTLQVRSAYGSGMGMWCAQCHLQMHTDLTSKIVHPIDAALNSLKDTYNSYVKTGDMTGGQLTSYNSLVPYADLTRDHTALATLAGNSAKLQPGPDSGTAQVMCLSCHRAHASGWPEMLRWKYQDEFITWNGMYPGTDNGASEFARGRTAFETQGAYYDRPVTDFANYQRILCNKCHAKD